MVLISNQIDLFSYLWKPLPHTEHVSADTASVTSMQHINGRADSHLNSQVECELESVGKQGWVNQAYCGTPPLVRHPVSTVYNIPPHFGAPNPYQAETTVLNQQPEKKKSGCCSAFLRGKCALTFCCPICLIPCISENNYLKSFSLFNMRDDNVLKKLFCIVNLLVCGKPQFWWQMVTQFGWTKNSFWFDRVMGNNTDHGHN